MSQVDVRVARHASAGVEAGLSRLVDDRVASRTAAGDPTVWGPDAESEAAVRLAWTRLHETSRELVPRIQALRDELLADGVDRVVLAGMGGSSLAPEVICATHGVELVTLDATDAGQVRNALVELERTVLVVSSKSGSTVETDSQRRVFVEAFTAAGIDAASRIVVVTDPGSALETVGRDDGYRAVFLADPEVGGRYSALTAFGLVPSGIAGADMSALLDEAAGVAELLATDSADNPALALGAAMARSPAEDGGTRDKLVLVDVDSGLQGFADWAEQLIAESTGKQGTGVLPVVAGSTSFEVTHTPGDVLIARVRSVSDDELPVDLTVSGPLGAQMLLWEYATVAAGALLGINPFDQPDVESAKVAARGMLEESPEQVQPDFTVGGVSVTATDGLLDESTDTLDAAVSALLQQVSERGYLAVMAYLDRLAVADLAGVRDPLAGRVARPVTFGWGPRFLHSTGQFHKGGPAVGVFLQIVGDLDDDLPVPGRDFTFGRLKASQAEGDASVLAEHGRPVLTLRVSDAAGLAAVRAALGQGTA